MAKNAATFALLPFAGGILIGIVLDAMSATSMLFLFMWPLALFVVVPTAIASCIGGLCSSNPRRKQEVAITLAAIVGVTAYANLKFYL